MYKLIAIFLLQPLIIQSYAQADLSFRAPLDIPMVLSGNFGEIRADHFHSGIDIKTNGSTGYRVYSIDDGYVSRIKVQANGYGKSIYIDHPGGYTSVYGHLDRYRDDIASYVRNLQYNRRTHTLDLYLDPGEFSIAKGDLIAFSGNTGGSSGPHLHFEVRTSGNQHPTNVLKYGFDIADRVAPRFHSFSLTPEGDNSHVNGKAGKHAFQVVKDQGMYTVPYGTIIRAAGKLGVSVEVFDYLNGAPNRCGVYKLKMELDGKEVFSFSVDEFSFSETRYVNAHIEYGDLVNSNKRIHRLHRLPNDRLRIYDKLEEDGWVTLKDNKKHLVNVIAEDVAGNSATLQFEITGDTASRSNRAVIPDNGTMMHWNEPNIFSTGEVEVKLPGRALYDDIRFRYGKSPGTEGMLSDLYQIHLRETPVHLPYDLSIRFSPSDPRLKEKLLLITYDEEGELEEAGGEYKDGAVVASLRSFGPFAIAADTTRPEIIPLGRISTGDISGDTEIRFTIMDDLSGIEDYEGFIDNHWALFEYDPKNDLLTYTIDPERIKSGIIHELELYITDAKGNVNLYHQTFKW